MSSKVEKDVQSEQAKEQVATLKPEVKGVLVEEQDLHLYGELRYVTLFLHGLVAGLAGLFGTIYLSLGLGFINVDLAYGVMFGMATYGFGRSLLLKYVIIGWDYQKVFRFVRFVRFVVVVSLLFYFLTILQLSSYRTFSIVQYSRQLASPTSHWAFHFNGYIRLTT